MQRILYDMDHSINVSGKTIVFTGGTDGMGRVAVEKLARLKATIYLLGRNEGKTKSVIEELIGSTGNNSIFYVPCDLSKQNSVRNASEILNSKLDSIDFLINCAGVNSYDQVITEDGYELCWATNHLGPFLLTNLLLEMLKKAPSARIVNLSSAMQKYARIDFDAILTNKKISTMNRQSMPKLAMLMCTQELAKKLENSSVTINALNPGFINTNLLRNATGFIKPWVALMNRFASSPSVGANRILALATSHAYDNVSGKFIYEDHIREPNREARDESIVTRIWNISNQQVGLTQ